MKKLLLILCLPLLVISCPKEEIEPENNGEILAEANIGTAGGVVEADGISITVPPGAFSSMNTVQIATEEEYADDFGDNSASPAYRITGIPASTSGSIRLAIRYNVNLEYESFLAWGGIDSLDEEEVPVTSYALYETTDSSGYLVAQIPPFGTEADNNSGLKSTSGIVPFIFIAKTLFRMISETGSYFKVECPYRIEKQKILKLVNSLDEAMQSYIEMKLVDQAVIDAMLLHFGLPCVVVADKKDTKSLDYIVSMPSLAKCAMPINGQIPLERYHNALQIKINILNSAVERLTDEELKSYAYLWVYRMIYYMYFGDQMDWFAYSTALWMQEKFTGTSDYPENLFDICGMSPFKGMEAGSKTYLFNREVKLMYGGTITRNVELHAAGMYPFVKYMDQRFGDNKERT